MKRLRLRNWSLRAKLAALLIAASVMPLGISALIDIQTMRQERIAEAQSLLAARADQISRELDSTHKGYQRSTERVANLPAVLAYCVAPPLKRADHAARLLGVFATFNKSDPGIQGVAVIDPTGHIVLASETSLVGADISTRSTFQQAIQGTAVISGISFVRRQTGLQPTVAYLAPVRDADNRIRCVIALGVSGKVFWDVLESAHAQAGAHSFAVLYDEWGIRIGLSTEHAMLYRPSGPIDPAVLDSQVAQNRFGPRTREFLEDVKAFPEHFERARAASPDQAMFRGWAPVNGAWSYGIARRLHSLHWTVFYIAPEADILASIAEATRQKILLALAIIAVAAALGVAFAASILRQVQALSKATSELAAGRSHARVRGMGHDELGKLGASFNAMAHRIQTQADDLLRSNEALRKYAGELELANKDLDAFAFSVSHDLRAPLHVVDGFSSMLANKFSGQLDSDATHYLTRIRAGVALMQQMIQGILKLSRLGREPLNKQAVPLMDLVHEVLVQLRSEGVLTDDRVQIAGDLPQVQADRVLLRQVFSNLLSNACKFTAHRAMPEVCVGTEWHGGEQVYFVRDNGAGFDPAHALKLFEPFQRLHTAEEFAGLGIGLSIVKRIVEFHGGRIWAEAAVDKGACFYFTLDGAAASGPEASGAADAPAPSATA